MTARRETAPALCWESTRSQGHVAGRAESYCMTAGQSTGDRRLPTSSTFAPSGSRKRPSCTSAFRWLRTLGADLLRLAADAEDECLEVGIPAGCSSHPLPLRAAPNSVTGSLCDHMALRGPASPLWSALSASVRRGSTDAKKASVCLISPSSRRSHRGLTADSRRRSLPRSHHHRGCTPSPPEGRPRTLYDRQRRPESKSGDQRATEPRADITLIPIIVRASRTSGTRIPFPEQATPSPSCIACDRMRARTTGVTEAAKRQAAMVTGAPGRVSQCISCEAWS
jgi:hypothetical protein